MVLAIFITHPPTHLLTHALVQDQLLYYCADTLQAILRSMRCVILYRSVLDHTSIDALQAESY